MGAFNLAWKPLALSFHALPDACTRPDDGLVLSGLTSPRSTLFLRGKPTHKRTSQEAKENTTIEKVNPPSQNEEQKQDGWRVCRQKVGTTRRRPRKSLKSSCRLTSTACEQGSQNLLNKTTAPNTVSRAACRKKVETERCRRGTARRSDMIRQKQNGAAGLQGYRGVCGGEESMLT